MKKGTKIAGIILLVIGLLTFMKIVLKAWDAIPLRTNEYVIGGCGIVLFFIGIYSLRKSNNQSKK
ncbi:MAG: hypothetical protein RLZZ500_2587 [Bacteroidota bacterium]